MRTSRTRGGYTLIELIVSVGLFSLIMLVITTAYLNLVHLDRTSRATTDVMTNLSFVVESMSREIRAGSGYKCNTNGTNCASPGSPGSSFRFTDSRSRTITYTLSNGQILEQINSATPVALTDPRITVAKLNFYVRGVGTTAGDAYLEPQATFVLQGTIQAEPEKQVEFTLQGSATQRLLELI